MTRQLPRPAPKTTIRKASRARRQPMTATLEVLSHMIEALGRASLIPPVKI